MIIIAAFDYFAVGDFELVPLAVSILTRLIIMCPDN